MREPVRTIRHTQRRQFFTLKNERARPNHQKETPASMMVPLKTNARVTVLQNHEGGHHFFRTRPNMACKRRRWRGPESAAFFMRVACRQPWRSRKLPAARLRPSVGPPNHGVPHFTAARTRIRRKFCTRTHEISRPNYQKETEASIVVHLKSKYPVRTTKKRPQVSIVYMHARTRLSEPSDTDTGVNSFTHTHEIARPNRQIRTPASIILHTRTK